MAMTLSQLRDLIVAKTGIAGNRDFPIARLNQIINFAQHFVQINLNGLGYKRWEKSASTTLTAGSLGSISVQTAPVPTDMLETSQSIRLIDVTDGTNHGTSSLELTPAQFEAQCKNSYLAPTVVEPAFMRLSGKIYFYPNTINAATLHYWSELAALAADGDTLGVPDEFAEFVVRQAVNAVQADLGIIKDKVAADQEIVVALKNAYQQVVSQVIDSTQSAQSRKPEAIAQ